MIGYDDWWVLPCGQGNGDVASLSVGEGRAHAEASRRYSASFRCLAGACFDPWEHGGGSKGGGDSEGEDCGAWMEGSAWGAIFEVVSVGSAGGGDESPPSRASWDHGFTMGPAASARFVASNALCRSIRADGAVYTLQDEAGRRRAEAAVASGVSGVVLAFSRPLPGEPWQRSLGVALGLDVSGEGYDADAVRREPSAYQLCYAATAGPAGGGGGDGQMDGPSGGGGGDVSAVQHANGEDAAASVEAALSHVAPVCVPVVRGGAALEDVAVPPPAGPWGRGGATVWAWLQRAPAPAGPAAAAEGVHGDAAAPTGVPTAGATADAEAAAPRRIALASVRIGPPAAALASSSFDTATAAATRERSSDGDGVAAPLFWPRDVEVGRRAGGGGRRLEPRAQDYRLPFSSSSSSSHASPVLLALTRPRAGDPVEPLAGGVAVELGVDALAPGAGAAEVRARPEAFRVCISGGDGGGGGVGEGSAGEGSAGEAPYSYCVPLVAPPATLPLLRVACRRSANLGPASSSSSSAAAWVEAWLEAPLEEVPLVAAAGTAGSAASPTPALVVGRTRVHLAPRGCPA